MAWAKAAMSTSELAIPKVCPNCMKPADRPWPTTYQAGNRSYLQTFFYCERCDAMFQRNRMTARLLLWAAPLGIAGGFGVAVALQLAGAMLVAAAVGVPIVLMVAIWLVRRRSPPEGAVGTTFAVFYCGDETLGIGMKLRRVSHYRAARDEWLEALIDANPSLTDPDEYFARRGKDRPIAVR
jgi:hypothetical protein